MPSWQGGAPCHLRLLSPASSLLPASPPHLAQQALVPLWVPFQPRGGVLLPGPPLLFTGGGRNREASYSRLAEEACQSGRGSFWDKPFLHPRGQESPGKMDG